jgi:hypothetical protein
MSPVTPTGGLLNWRRTPRRLPLTTRWSRACRRTGRPWRSTCWRRSSRL